jgi:hypothetical protein
MTNLLQLTINVRKSHCNSQCTLQLVCKDHMLFDVIFTFLCEVNSIQNASNKLVSCIYLYFVKFAFHPTPQTKILRC